MFLRARALEKYERAPRSEVKRPFLGDRGEAVTAGAQLHTRERSSLCKKQSRALATNGRRRAGERALSVLYAQKRRPRSCIVLLFSHLGFSRVRAGSPRFC